MHITKYSQIIELIVGHWILVDHIEFGKCNIKKEKKKKRDIKNLELKITGQGLKKEFCKVLLDNTNNIVEETKGSFIFEEDTISCANIIPLKIHYDSKYHADSSKKQKYHITTGFQRGEVIILSPESIQIKIFDQTNKKTTFEEYVNVDGLF